MTAKIFIDGEVGTTGLQIRARLEARADVELLRLADAERKDPARRAELLNSVDLAILCLPDAAAREARAALSIAIRATGDADPTLVRRLDARPVRSETLDVAAGTR